MSHKTVSIECFTYPVLMLDAAGAVSAANSAASAYFSANNNGPLLGACAADALRQLTRLSDRTAVLTPKCFVDAPAAIHCDAVDATGREFLVSLVPCPDEATARVAWMLSLLEHTDARLAQRQRAAALRFMTHDLRAPLSSVVALLDLHRFNASAMAQPEMLGRIEGHAHKVLDMIDAFVECAEVELRDRRVGYVDLVDAMAEAIDEVWQEAGKRDVRLYPIGEQWETAVCRAEREPLMRAIRRLLQSAIRRSPSAAPVAWELEQRDAHWAIAISDSAASADSPALPMPHTETLSRDTPGLDLGLAVVVATAAKYGGCLERQHHPAGGSTYRLVIPK